MYTLQESPPQNAQVEANFYLFNVVVTRYCSTKYNQHACPTFLPPWESSLPLSSQYHDTSLVNNDRTKFHPTERYTSPQINIYSTSPPVWGVDAQQADRRRCQCVFAHPTRPPFGKPKDTYRTHIDYPANKEQGDWDAQAKDSSECSRGATLPVASTCTHR